MRRLFIVLAIATAALTACQSEETKVAETSTTTEVEPLPGTATVTSTVVTSTTATTAPTAVPPGTTPVPGQTATRTAPPASTPAPAAPPASTPATPPASAQSEPAPSTMPPPQISGGTSDKKLPATHKVDHGGVLHAANAKDAATKCIACHGKDLKGGKMAKTSCFECHEKKWN